MTTTTTTPQPDPKLPAAATSANNGTAGGPKSPVAETSANNGGAVGSEQPASPPLRSPTTKGKKKRFFSAYAKTWVGMTPMFLMAEAVIPGQKVGGTFKKGLGELGSSANELIDIFGVQGKDVIVVLDQHFKLAERFASNGSTTDGKALGKWDEQSRRAAEIIRAAGQDAIVAVSTSLENAQSQIQSSSPALKQSVTTHGRDMIVLVDKSLKNPIVITGVTKFARAQGIPYSEGLLQLASMGLSRILAHLPEDVGDAVEGEVLDEVSQARKREGGTGRVTEVDAAELERTRSDEERAEALDAAKLGKDDNGQSPKVENEGKCVIS